MTNLAEQEGHYSDDVHTILAETYTEGHNSISEDFTTSVLSRNPISIFRDGEPDPDATEEFFNLLPDGIDDRKAVSRLFMKKHRLFSGASETGIRLFIDMAAERSIIKGERELGKLRRMHRETDSGWNHYIEADIQAARTLQKRLWDRDMPTPAPVQQRR